MEEELPLLRKVDRLKYCRLNSKYPVEDIAAYMCCSVSTLRRWENRNHELKNVDKLIQLAMLYNVSYIWLAHGLGSMEHTYLEGHMEEEMADLYRSAPRYFQVAIYNFALALREKSSKWTENTDIFKL